MKQAKVLKETEIKRLIKVCELTRYKERNRLIVMFSFLCGLRAVEIANLRVSNVISDTNEALDFSFTAANTNLIYVTAVVDTSWTGATALS